METAYLSRRVYLSPCEKARLSEGVPNHHQHNLDPFSFLILTTRTPKFMFTATCLVIKTVFQVGENNTAVVSTGVKE